MNVALPPQSPGTHTVKPTSQTLENPLGSVDLVNPLGQSGTLPKLDPMSNPPQNANSPTQATDLGNLQSPSRPIPLNQGTAIKTSGFSWDG